jgi:hypothetical protein
MQIGLVAQAVLDEPNSLDHTDKVAKVDLVATPSANAARFQRLGSGGETEIGATSRAKSLSAATTAAASSGDGAGLKRDVSMLAARAGLALR